MFFLCIGEHNATALSGIHLHRVFKLPEAAAIMTEYLVRLLFWKDFSNLLFL